MAEGGEGKPPPGTITEGLGRLARNAIGRLRPRPRRLPDASSSEIDSARRVINETIKIPGVSGPQGEADDEIRGDAHHLLDKLEPYAATPVSRRQVLKASAAAAAGAVLGGIVGRATAPGPDFGTPRPAEPAGPVEPPQPQPPTVTPTKKPTSSPTATATPSPESTPTPTPNPEMDRRRKEEQDNLLTTNRSSKSINEWTVRLATQEEKNRLIPDEGTSGSKVLSKNTEITFSNPFSLGRPGDLTEEHTEITINNRPNSENEVSPLLRIKIKKNNTDQYEDKIPPVVKGGKEYYIVFERGRRFVFSGDRTEFVKLTYDEKGSIFTAQLQRERKTSTSSPKR